MSKPLNALKRSPFAGFSVKHLEWQFLVNAVRPPSDHHHQCPYEDARVLVPG